MAGGKGLLFLGRGCGVWGLAGFRDSGLGSRRNLRAGTMRLSLRRAVSGQSTVFKAMSAFLGLRVRGVSS